MSSKSHKNSSISISDSISSRPCTSQHGLLADDDDDDLDVGVDDAVIIADEPDGLMKDGSNNMTDISINNNDTTTGSSSSNSRRRKRLIKTASERLRVSVARVAGNNNNKGSTSTGTATNRMKNRRHYVSTSNNDSDDDDNNTDNSNEDDTVTGNWSMDDENNNNNNTSDNNDNNNNNNGKSSNRMTQRDIAMCQILDLEYEQALEDRQVAWNARYQSVRQSTLFSIIFMILLIITGTTFFLKQSNSFWTIPEGLLFTIYTITTVGYGHLDVPNTPTFQLYTIIFIFLGIAMLTILVAQVYQCIALEASRVVAITSDNNQQRTNNTMRRWLEARVQEQRNNNNNNNSGINTTTPGNTTTNNTSLEQQNQQQLQWADTIEWCLQNYDNMRTFLRENEYGKAISVVLPFALLIGIGAAVIGPLEGWSIVESIYFAVVSLTTVGFGDYYPTRTISIWFCCIWLPFSVGFMSLYLANVAAFYIRLSDKNVTRIERILRRRLQRLKERAEQERKEVLQRALRGQQQQNNDNNENDNSSAHASSRSGHSSNNYSLPNSEHNGHQVMSDTSSTGRRHQQQATLRKAATRLRGFKQLSTEGDEMKIGDDDQQQHPSSSRNSSSIMSSDDDDDDEETGLRQRRHSKNNKGRMLFGSHGGANPQRRERIIRNSQKHTELAGDDDDDDGGSPMTMATMNDVLRAVHRNNPLGSNNDNDNPDRGMQRLGGTRQLNPEAEFLSVASRNVLQHDRRTVRKKPSFALRVLVLERFAEIIATDIAGYQSNIEIKECTLAVTIQSLKHTADKWSVPRRARKAFRAVAFEALYFVGEHGLITRGADALFSLTPFEFHQIFSPLLAALGDAETMESWLSHTETLADVDLSERTSTRGRSRRRKQQRHHHHRRSRRSTNNNNNSNSKPPAQLKNDSTLEQIEMQTMSNKLPQSPVPPPPPVDTLTGILAPSVSGDLSDDLPSIA